MNGIYLGDAKNNMAAGFFYLSIQVCITTTSLIEEYGSSFQSKRYVQVTWKIELTDDIVLFLGSMACRFAQ